MEQAREGNIFGSKKWNERRKIMIVGRNAGSMYLKVGYPSDMPVVERYSDKYGAQGLEIKLI